MVHCVEVNIADEEQTEAERVEVHVGRPEDGHRVWFWRTDHFNPERSIMFDKLD